MAGADNGAAGQGAKGVATGQTGAAGAGSGVSGLVATPTPTQTPSDSGNGVDHSTSIPSPNWTTSLNEDAKEYVQQKGFKDPTAVLDSYRNMEKLMGVPQERLVKLPAKADDPGWNDVYEKLGRPKDAKEYQLDPLKTDEKFADWARNAFFKNGISKSAGEKLATELMEYGANVQKSKVDAYNLQVAKESDSLKKEWGLAYDKHVAIAKQTANTFKIDGPTIDKLESSMGFSGVMRFLHDLGSKIGESSFHSDLKGGGNTFNNSMTPAAAQARINALKRDSDFVRRYTEGDAAAQDEFTRLHIMMSAQND